VGAQLAVEMCVRPPSDFAAVFGNPLEQLDELREFARIAQELADRES
jgi:hypothetical protein